MFKAVFTSHPCGELWHCTRADGFANVRFTHTSKGGWCAKSCCVLSVGQIDACVPRVEARPGAVEYQFMH